jgi:hypothetical protein
VANLLIVDGSVFVTAGSANPTSTIAALALRAADQLLASRPDLPRPAHRRDARGSGRLTPTPARAGVGVPVRALTAAERSHVLSIADLLIPGTDEMPSAAQVDVAGSLLDRVVRARPDLVAPLRDALEGHEPGEVSSEELRHDERFAPLRYVVAAAYYLDDRVRAALRYDPERVAPVRALDFPEYLDEGLLDHLVESS